MGNGIESFSPSQRNRLARLARRAQQAGREGWLLALNQPTYVAVMTAARSRALRRAYCEAWFTRASDAGPLAGLDGGKFDNGPVIENILRLRHEAARLLGDLSENGDYHAAKDEQGHMEGRIRELEHLLDNGEIIELGDAGVVAAGSIVTIVYEGEAESDAERYLIGHLEERMPGLDVMSPKSPLGSALLGHEAGQWVEYDAPNGALRVKLIKVEHP